MTWVQPLSQEGPLEEGLATHSSILAWRIPVDEKPGGLSPCGCKESDMTEGTEHLGMHTLLLKKVILKKNFFCNWENTLKDHLVQ